MKYSALLRVWHWLNALAIFGLLGTFFLRKTFLSWRTNSELMVQKFAEYDIQITTEMAKTVAKAIRAHMWEWHIIFGYFFLSLIIFRIYIFVKEGVSYKDNSSLHKKAVGVLYSIFYLVVIFMGLSGVFLHLGADFGVSKDSLKEIKELHELSAWFFVVFVPLHIAGVVMAELSSEKGIVSRMISGK